MTSDDFSLLMSSSVPPSKRNARHLLRVLLSAWTWLAIGVATAVGFLVQLALWPLVIGWDAQRRILGRTFRLAAVAAIKMSPMWKFSVASPLPPLKPARTVVISNHVSHLDAFLIAHLPWEMKWLAKASLFRIPFLGWSMRLAGDICVVRNERSSIGEAMRSCAGYLSAGMPVFIFPEGTRSTERGMLPFKDGAFRLAIEGKANILPLAVAGTRRALPKRAWLFDRSRGLVSVGEPLSTTGMTLADIPRLKQAARDQIEEMLKVLRPLAVPSGGQTAQPAEKSQTACM